MKKNYKPKATNEIALKKYITNATKKGNFGYKRSNNSKR